MPLLTDSILPCSLLSKILQAFGHPAFPIDTRTFHVLSSFKSPLSSAHRMLTRLFLFPFACPVDVHRLALRWGLSKSQDVKKVESDLKVRMKARTLRDRGYVCLHTELVPASCASL